MTTGHAISNEKYVSFASFRKDGSVKELPVWIADLGDGTVGFTTSSSSYKVKRVRANSAVTLQPCDQRGNVTAGSEKVAGTAVIGSADDFERVRALVKSKYGFQYTMISIVGSVAKLLGRGSGTDTAIIITPT